MNRLVSVDGKEMIPGGATQLVILEGDTMSRGRSPGTGWRHRTAVRESSIVIRCTAEDIHQRNAHRTIAEEKTGIVQNLVTQHGCWAPERSLAKGSHNQTPEIDEIGGMRAGQVL